VAAWRGRGIGRGRSMSGHVSMQQAGAGVWDALVIGAGPAGGAAATRLAQGGARVLLVDRVALPRGKVCGCCLGPMGVGALRAFGAEGVLAGARDVRDVMLVCGGRGAGLAMPPMAVIGREALDARLVEFAQGAGASVLWSVSARVEADDTVTLTDADGSSVRARARVVLVCDGLAGASLRERPAMAARVSSDSRIGVGAAVEAGARELDLVGEGLMMLVARGGYLGVVALPDGRVDLAAALDAEVVRRAGGTAAAVQRVIEECCLVDGGAVRTRVKGSLVSDDSGGKNGEFLVLLARALLALVERGAERKVWRGTAALTRSRAVVQCGRLVVVGDSAGYVEPFTGEGMGWALAGGAAAGGLALRAIGSDDAGVERVLGAWPGELAALVGRRRGKCGVVASLARRPRVVSALVRVAAWSPGVSSSLITGLGLAARMREPHWSAA